METGATARISYMVGSTKNDITVTQAGAADARKSKLHRSLFASYTEIMVSNDYPELVRLFGERVAEQAEKTRIALNGPKIQGIPNAPITAEGCEVISYQDDLKGKVVVIKPEVLRREYRRATSQLQLCTGGFGAPPKGVV